MESIKTLFLISLFSFVSVHHAGIIKDSDLGEPLTPEDFEFAESEEYQNIIANEVTHGENVENESTELFEGDVSEEQRQVLMEQGRSGLRQVIKSRRWPKGVDGIVRIPYKIDKGLSQKRRGDIAKAVMEYEKTNCIRFVEYKGEKYHYININTNVYDCGTQPPIIGMLDAPYRNYVHFGPRCTWGNLCHELMHSLGFHHEHTRPNRDKYIKIVWENIPKIPETLLRSFRKCERCDDLGDPYDYGSIMHYSTKYYGNTIIIPKEIIPPGVKIGQRERLSPLDIQGINDFYEC